jgi:Undecaprenyl-phosphate glucose phosphotransferase
MLKKSISKILFFTDLLIINMSFLSVYIHYHDSIYIPLNAVLLMLCVSILWFFISINNGILRINNQSTLPDIIKSQIAGYSVLSAGIISIVAVFGDFRTNYKLILYPLLFTFIFSLAYRFFFLAGMKRIVKSGYKQQRVLIIGGGSVAKQVMKQITSAPELGYRLYGVIAEEMNGHIPAGYYLGDYSRFYDTVRAHLIDEVIIALPLRQKETILQMIDKCEAEGVRVRIVPDFFSIIRNRAVLERLGEIPLISTRTEPLSLLRNRIVKRSFDVCFSFFVLIFFSPVFLVLAMLIKVTSRGPVFFKQKRIGSNNLEFDIYKFRSMVVQDVKDTDTKWTTKEDLRVTKIGKFIRKTSLDELPQFWNVLIGDMTVVGPRPEREHFVEEFRKHIGDYKVRHLIKSGITGWAQVNGWRGDTSIRKRVEHDIYYIENWRLMFDIKIIFQTVFGKNTMINAY